MKLISFMRAADDVERTDFQHWFVTDFAEAVAREFPRLAYLAADVVHPPAANRPMRPSSDPTANDAAGSRPPYDVVLEVKTESAEDWRRVLAKLESNELRRRAAARHAYRVTDTVIWDNQPLKSGTVTPGIKFIGRLMFHADMPDSAVKRSWGLHAVLAKKVHVGCSKYVQNWVEETLAPDAPQTRGMPQLNFPSEQDFIERFFDSPRGREEILHDVSHFVQHGPRMATAEHVLLAMP